MSEIEQAKLYQYIKEASCAQEARLYRLLKLLKLGFTSLEPLRLVDMSDLVGPKIPKGQRRLILQIAVALGDPTNNQSKGGTVTDGTAVCHPSAEDTVTSRFTAT